jgi:uncharacterized protein (TIGR03437 family)
LRGGQAGRGREKKKQLHDLHPAALILTSLVPSYDENCFMRLAAIWLCLVSHAALADGAPELSARDIVRSADHFAGGVSPGEIVLLFPSNAGPEILVEGQRKNGKLVTLLSDTRVLFDGVAAPVVYTVKGQVSAIVPYEIAGKKTTQVEVEYQGVRSSPVTLPVVNTAPALFTLDSTGRGQAAMLNETGCCNSPRNPAARGSVVSLYATGEGQTNPPGITGLISSYAKPADYPAPSRKVRVTVGGLPAQILYAAEAPHTAAGLLQVNFRVPENAPVGDAVPLVLSVGDTRSPEGLTMAVRTALKQVLLLDLPSATRVRLHRILTAAGYHVTSNQEFVDLIISSLGASEHIAGVRAAQPRAKLIAMAPAIDTDTLRSADLLGAQAVLSDSMTSQSMLRRVRELLRPRIVPYVAMPDIVGQAGSLRRVGNPPAATSSPDSR